MSLSARAKFNTRNVPSHRRMISNRTGIGARDVPARFVFLAPELKRKAIQRIYVSNPIAGGDTSLVTFVAEREAKPLVLHFCSSMNRSLLQTYHLEREKLTGRRSGFRMFSWDNNKSLGSLHVAVPQRSVF